MAGPPSQPDVSVVLPLYRTGAVLEELCSRLVATLEAAGRTFELLLIDDGSPDEAWAIARRLGKADPRIKGVRLSRNFGQHPAIGAGFDHATGSAIVLMDADLQDQPEDLPKLLERLGDDVDLVYTVKVDAHESFLTRLTSRMYHSIFSSITKSKVPRHIGTYRVFSSRVLDAIRQFPERNVLFGPLMFHMGFDYVVVDVQRPGRPQGKSAYTFSKRLQLALNSLLAYTDLPHRLLVAFGAGILGLSGLYAVALVVRYLVSPARLPPGLTLVALLITFSLGSTTLALGVVGSYVFRVYQEVLARPRYVVARRMNLPDPE